MAASGAQGAGLGSDDELDDHPGAHEEGAPPIGLGKQQEGAPAAGGGLGQTNVTQTRMRTTTSSTRSICPVPCALHCLSLEFIYLHVSVTVRRVRCEAHGS